eukprot:scaffold343_cov120-Isochrysis_galbana.AAC.2
MRSLPMTASQVPARSEGMPAAPSTRQDQSSGSTSTASSTSEDSTSEALASRFSTTRLSWPCSPSARLIPSHPVPDPSSSSEEQPARACSAITKSYIRRAASHTCPPVVCRSTSARKSDVSATSILMPDVLATSMLMSMRDRAIDTSAICRAPVESPATF